jgi:hypothetical protein
MNEQTFSEQNFNGVVGDTHRQLRLLREALSHLRFKVNVKEPSVQQLEEKARELEDALVENYIDIGTEVANFEARARIAVHGEPVQQTVVPFPYPVECQLGGS